MPFTAQNITNIINVAQLVLADNTLKYVGNLAQGLKQPNDKSGCGSVCGMKSLYQFITQALYRQSEMTGNANYQTLIGQLFECISLTPEWQTYTGGANVINAAVTPLTGNSYSYADISMNRTPAAGSTVIPTSTQDQQTLIGTTITLILREGVGMQTTDNTRPDYYSFNPATGQITLNVAANGAEQFQIIYKTLIPI